MAKFSKKVGGKEIGDADVYAKPHTMSGGSVNPKEYITVKDMDFHVMNKSNFMELIA